LTIGSTVLEMDPNGQAARQIHSLVDDLKEVLNQIGRGRFAEADQIIERLYP